MTITFEEFKTLKIDKIMTNFFDIVFSDEDEDVEFYEKLEEIRYSKQTYSNIVQGKELHISTVYEEGDSEGGGSHSELVFSLNVDDVTRYARITGYYQSYNGTEWDEDFIEVWPKEVKSIRYFDKP